MPAYSFGTQIALNLAGDEAYKTGFNQIEPVHLVLSIMRLCTMNIDEFARQKQFDTLSTEQIKQELVQVQKIFSNSKVDLNKAYQRISQRIKQSNPSPSKGLHRSEICKMVFKEAESALKTYPVPTNEIVLVHLLVTLLARPKKESWQHEYMQDINQAVFPPEHKEILSAQKPSPSRSIPINPEQKTNPFSKFGRDLTQLAQQGKIPVPVGRQAEMDRIIATLMLKNSNNPILIGESGVGKTRIIEGVALRIIQHNVPPVLIGQSLIEINSSTLSSGRNEILEQSRSAPKTILFFKGLYTPSVMQVVKFIIDYGVPVIAAVSPANYEQSIKKDPALAGVFQPIWVEEPPAEEALEILRAVCPQYERHHQCKIDESAQRSAIQFSLRYMPEQKLPAKAIELIDHACAYARVHARPDVVVKVTQDEVAAIVSEKCKVPVERLTVDEQKRLLGMEDFVMQRVMGQDEAVRAVAHAIRSSRLVKNSTRPIGTFLFAGSTGTGKTELAKAIAEFLFDDENRIIRLDMSEYFEAHMIARMIGSPPGYKDSEEEGQLTGPVRKKPYSVVLFDEVEKAHPKVLDILLPILDEGRLKDSHGRLASFSECVVIITTNLGAGDAMEIYGHHLIELLRRKAGNAELQLVLESYRRKVLEGMKQKLRPELFNRFKEVLIFNPLTLDAIRLIIDKMIRRQEKGMQDRGIQLKLSSETYDFLIEHGYDPYYGAREMERTIENHIMKPLVQQVYQGQIEKQAKILVTCQNGMIQLVTRR